jgi:hypothetical protein
MKALVFGVVVAVLAGVGVTTAKRLPDVAMARATRTAQPTAPAGAEFMLEVR